MTRAEAIAELIRIWHSPHLDLILKAGLAEAIETLKEKNCSDSLVTDSSDACKESESKLDLINRQDAIKAVWKLDKDANEYVVDDAKEIHGYCTAIGVCVGELSALPSAEAVDVVRCKDCKHRDPEDQKCDCGHDIMWQLPREDDWFCCDGMRKDGESDE